MYATLRRGLIPLLIRSTPSHARSAIGQSPYAALNNCRISPFEKDTNGHCSRRSFVSHAANYSTTIGSIMKALVFAEKDRVTIEERPKPDLSASTDAIVKLKHTTICGTDLHIIKGDVPTATPGRILGHEGVGEVEALGSSVEGLHVGDTVLISCITACAACGNCRKRMHSHCDSGGWILGNEIDGTQAEYVRIPHAMSSLYRLPRRLDLREAVMLSDALPTGMECGTLKGNVQPGCSVVIIGAGPVGLSAMMTAQLYSPSLLVVVDIDEARLAMAQGFGASHTVNSRNPNGVKELLELTGGQGFDTVIEAVGIPGSFRQCQELVAVGGTIANMGVHGAKVDLHLEKLWDRNISMSVQYCPFIMPAFFIQ